MEDSNTLRIFERLRVGKTYGPRKMENAGLKE
jgi:hypothetical protein